MGKGKKNTRVTKQRGKGKLIVTCHGYQHNANTDSLRKQNLLFFYFQFIWDIFEHFYTVWNVRLKYYSLSKISNLNEAFLAFLKVSHARKFLCGKVSWLYGISCARSSLLSLLV